MSLSKPFLIVLLAYLITIVLAQTTSNATETNIATATTSDVLISSSSGAISSTLLPSSTALSSAPSSLEASTSVSSSTVPLLPSSTSLNAVPTVQGTGWNSNENDQANNQQSWLRQNNRFVFVIFVGLFVVAILIWYIVRSIKGMRKRLEQENQAQLYMMQQATSPSPPRNDRVIPELTQTPPPAYKTEANTPVHPAEPRQ